MLSSTTTTAATAIMMDQMKINSANKTSSSASSRRHRPSRSAIYPEVESSPSSASFPVKSSSFHNKNSGSFHNSGTNSNSNNSGSFHKSGVGGDSSSSNSNIMHQGRDDKYSRYAPTDGGSGGATMMMKRTSKSFHGREHRDGDAAGASSPDRKHATVPRRKSKSFHGMAPPPPPPPPTQSQSSPSNREHRERDRHHSHSGHNSGHHRSRSQSQNKYSQRSRSQSISNRQTHHNRTHSTHHHGTAAAGSRHAEPKYCPSHKNIPVTPGEKCPKCTIELMKIAARELERRAEELAKKTRLNSNDIDIDVNGVISNGNSSKPRHNRSVSTAGNYSSSRNHGSYGGHPHSSSKNSKSKKNSRSSRGNADQEIIEDDEEERLEEINELLRWSSAFDSSSSAGGGGNNSNAPPPPPPRPVESDSSQSPPRNSSRRHYSSYDSKPLRDGSSRKLPNGVHAPPTTRQGSSKNNVKKPPQSQSSNNKSSPSSSPPPSPPLRRKLTLGTAAHPSEMLPSASREETLINIARLIEGDGAFVRRSDNVWTYATLKSRERYGPDASLTFTVNRRGATKSFPLTSWAKFVRLAAKPPPNAEVEGKEEAMESSMEEEEDDNASSVEDDDGGNYEIDEEEGSATSSNDDCSSSEEEEEDEIDMMLSEMSLYEARPSNGEQKLKRSVTRFHENEEENDDESVDIADVFSRQSFETDSEYQSSCHHDGVENDVDGEESEDEHDTDANIIQINSEEDEAAKEKSISTLYDHDASMITLHPLGKSHPSILHTSNYVKSNTCDHNNSKKNVSFNQRRSSLLSISSEKSRALSSVSSYYGDDDEEDNKINFNSSVERLLRREKKESANGNLEGTFQSSSQFPSLVEDYSLEGSNNEDEEHDGKMGTKPIEEENCTCRRYQQVDEIDDVLENDNSSPPPSNRSKRASRSDTRHRVSWSDELDKDELPAATTESKKKPPPNRPRKIPPLATSTSCRRLPSTSSGPRPSIQKRHNSSSYVASNNSSIPKKHVGELKMHSSAGNLTGGRKDASFFTALKSMHRRATVTCPNPSGVDVQHN